MSLEKIIDVRDIGALVNLKADGLGDPLPKILLFFGENGTGKSTFVDILRSLALNKPEIIKGRETLFKDDANPNVKLKIDGKCFHFNGGRWVVNGGELSKPYPSIKIFDSIFIDENIYSGSIVDRSHYQNQCEIIIGAEGVKLNEAITKNNEELVKIRKELKGKKEDLMGIIENLGSSISVEEFIKTENKDDINKLIENKEKDKKVVKNLKEINKIEIPKILIAPIVGENFEHSLLGSPENVPAVRYQEIRSHIKQHMGKVKVENISAENWIQVGAEFKKDDHCPFCAQSIKGIDIVKAYDSYFSKAYKDFYNRVVSDRKILSKYRSDEFKNEIEKSLEANHNIFNGYKTLADIDVPELPESEVKEALNEIKEVADFLDKKFIEKLEDLTQKIDAPSINENIQKWKKSREAIANYNKKLSAYDQEVSNHKQRGKEANFGNIEQELKDLRLIKCRFGADAEEKIKSFKETNEKQEMMEKDTANKKKELSVYSETIAKKLNNKMNEILEYLGANFGIEYGAPNFRGHKPIVELQLIIAKKKVQGRSSDELDEPNFKNTLSAGDKSTLALAFFLVTLKEENLQEKITILDDPFTSLDGIRRRKTACKIEEIAKMAKQTIIFSHDEHFLKLLSDNMSYIKGEIKCAKFPLSRRGNAVCDELNCIDLEEETESESRKNVKKIKNFVTNGEGNKNDILPILRKILENFYRNYDPGTFSKLDLGGIVRHLKETNGCSETVLEALKLIHQYSNEGHHGENASGPLKINEGELLNFCKDTLEIISCKASQPSDSP